MATDEDELGGDGLASWNFLRCARRWTPCRSTSTQTTRPDLVAGNGVTFPVLQDAAYSAADVGLASDAAARLNATFR